MWVLLSWSRPAIMARSAATQPAARASQPASMNVIGMMMGPLIVSTFTDVVFSEENIRYSLFLTALLMGPPAVFIFWAGMKPYGRAMASGGVLQPPPAAAK